MSAEDARVTRHTPRSLEDACFARGGPAVWLCTSRHPRVRAVIRRYGFFPLAFTFEAFIGTHGAGVSDLGATPMQALRNAVRAWRGAEGAATGD
ncbi:MAG: hypothetical protein ABFD96_00945 [Armatimonadia bacterium]